MEVHMEDTSPAESSTAEINEHCTDCALNIDEIAECYMVKDHVWRRAMPTEHGREQLCIGCLETRIGRTLMAYDFTLAPINTAPGPRSERLQKRLTAF
jgi:hypothetical protein